MSTSSITFALWWWGGSGNASWNNRVTHVYVFCPCYNPVVDGWGTRFIQVKLLLDNDAKVWLPDKADWTALHYAVLKDHLPVVSK